MHYAELQYKLQAGPELCIHQEFCFDLSSL